MQYSLEQLQEVVELATNFEREVERILRTGFPLENRPTVRKLLKRMVPYKKIFKHYIDRAILKRGATGLENIMPQELQ